MRGRVSYSLYYSVRAVCGVQRSCTPQTALTGSRILSLSYYILLPIVTVNFVKLATDKTHSVITNDLNERIFLYQCSFPCCKFY